MYVSDVMEYFDFDDYFINNILLSVMEVLKLKFILGGGMYIFDVLIYVKIMLFLFMCGFWNNLMKVVLVMMDGQFMNYLLIVKMVNEL